MKRTNAPSLRTLRTEIDTSTVELQREFRLRKLLLEELISSQTLTEKELLREMIRKNKRSIFLLEEKRCRFAQAENFVRNNMKGYEPQPNWDELHRLGPNTTPDSLYEEEAPLLTGTDS